MTLVRSLRLLSFGAELVRGCASNPLRIDKLFAFAGLRVTCSSDTLLGMIKILLCNSVVLYFTSRFFTCAILSKFYSKFRFFIHLRCANRCDIAKIRRLRCEMYAVNVFIYLTAAYERRNYYLQNY